MEDDPSTVPVRVIALCNGLSERKVKVELGKETCGITYECLEKLIIPFNKLTPQEIEQLRDLVGTVVDSASEPDFWEVET